MSEVKRAEWVLWNITTEHNSKQILNLYSTNLEMQKHIKITLKREAFYGPFELIIIFIHIVSLHFSLIVTCV